MIGYGIITIITIIIMIAMMFYPFWENKEGRENEPAGLWNRWIFSLSLITFLWFCPSWIAAAVLKTLNVEAGSRICPVILSSVVFSSTYIPWKRLTLFNGESDKAYLAEDKLFGRMIPRIDIKGYRIFFGNLFAKYPWEKIQKDDIILLKKKQTINFDFTVEVLDNDDDDNGSAGRALVKGTITIKRNVSKILDYIASEESIDSRKKLFETEISATATEYLQLQENIERDDRRALRASLSHTARRTLLEVRGEREVDEGNENPFIELLSGYGLSMTNFIVADVDDTQKVADTRDGIQANKMERRDARREFRATFGRAPTDSAADVKILDDIIMGIRINSKKVVKTARDINITGQDNLGPGGRVIVGDGLVPEN